MSEFSIRAGRIGVLILGLASVAGLGGAAEPAPPVNPPIKVIVLNYDPILTTKDHQRMSRFFHWSDPRDLTKRLVEDLARVSGGRARYQILDFIDINAFPLKRDRFRYTEESFLAIWADKSKAHQPDSVSYAEIFRTNQLTERIQKEDVREIWLWGAPYFGWDEYAMKFPGDQVYFETKNPWFYRPYDIPDCGKTVWVMGFSTERGEAEALHSYGHRCEGILSLTVGRGVWDSSKPEGNPWNLFTRTLKDDPRGGSVGNIHYPPNALSDYQYDRDAEVLSDAEDWRGYPALKGERKPINRDAWGGPDYHRNYVLWWLDHLPKGPGQQDGWLRDWWRYIVDHDAATSEFPPPGGRPRAAAAAMR